MRRKLVVAALLLMPVATAALVLGGASPASAHPLGNFSVNRYDGLRVGADRVAVDHVVDLAEIPTFQARRDIDRAGGLAPWARAICAATTNDLDLAVAGARVALRPAGSAARYGAGAGGLAVLRLGCTFAGRFASGHGAVALSFRDRGDADRVGWREVTAVGDGATLVASSVPRTSVSRRLTAYPPDLLSSPVRVASAVLRVRPGGAAAASASSAEPGARTSSLPLGAGQASRFASLVARDRVTVPFLGLALGLSLLLGALHAVAPGHGKTVLAAYLVGQRGSLRHAALLGLTVTLTHTLGVLVLGVLLSVSRLVAPERLLPWLTLASGLLVAGLGARLLLGAARRRAGVHDHHDHHDHHHHDHDHGRGHTHPHPHPHPHGERLSRRNLVTLGFAGGMVPTPSALVVLLGAIALGRLWLGVVLVLVYGAGMAATLTLTGLLLVRARGFVERRARRWEDHRGARLAGALAALPLATAVAIVVAGLGVAVRGAARL